MAAEALYSSASSSSRASTESISTPPSSPALSLSGDEAKDIVESDSELPDSPVQCGQVFPSHLSPPPSGVPETPDDVDANTPDRWIKRNRTMVRLTGKHPFNSEAPLPALYKSGFITPTSLFYVRNHGAVPNVDEIAAREWTVRVHGHVKNEMMFSIEDLKRLFPVVTVPVTFVCAGNRRKEQNVVQKGLGFSWGPGGISTAIFTGVYLCDVLEHVHPMRSRAKHVIFEGIDDLPNGPYGTSQRFSWAADPLHGMMIAWEMNGEVLEPDHGFPLRLVVPGQIGGRSVKWLRRIEVSEFESQHHLHFHDNKVLPTELTPQSARDPANKAIWRDPRYLIYDLNVNSAIARPEHNEVLSLASQSPYEVRGYAYAGGGRRINRVEVSFDEGETWTLADITYPEDEYRALSPMMDRDTCFCWCFWSYTVPVERLASASCHAIFVRAMDESLASQPRDMYWSPTGMMNNWYFRVAIHHETCDGNGVLRFEHPTFIGTDEGWMERMKNAGQDIMHPRFGPIKEVVGNTISITPPKTISMVNPAITRKITLSELEAVTQATSPADKKPWFVVKNEVYDGTGFLEDHPGGADSIWLGAAAENADATEDFMAIHSDDGKSKLAEFHIGTLVGSPDSNSNQNQEPTSDTATIFLHKTKFKPARLISITPASHDSMTYRFALSSPDQELGLPVGQHVYARLTRKGTGDVVQRAYTPVSQQSEKGYIDMLIKLYLANDLFPVGGRMTTGFHQLVLGDTIDLKGPLGSFIWEGQGQVRWKDRPLHVKNVGLICGGSGITPILQVLRAGLQDETDQSTRFWLINANKTVADILCRSDLDAMARDHGASGRFKMHHTLGQAPSMPDAWQGSFTLGRITDTLLRDHLPPPPTPGTTDSIILICGPGPMINLTVQPGLDRLGWDTKSSLVVF